MAVYGNGVDSGAMPAWTQAGDFAMTCAFYYIDNKLGDPTEVFLSGNASNFIYTTSGGSVIVRIGGVNHTFSGVLVGTYCRISIAVTAGVSSVTLNDGVPLSFGVGAVTFNEIMKWYSAPFYFPLSPLRELTITDGIDDRNYDFRTLSGITLPDLASGKDIILTTDMFDGRVSVPDFDITNQVLFNATLMDPSFQAQFVVSGFCPSGTTAIEASVAGGVWSVIDPAPTTTYSGVITVTKVQTVALRLANDPTQVTSIDFGAYLIVGGWGQSNYAGFGFDAQPLTLDPGAPQPLIYRQGIVEPLSDPTALPVPLNGPANGSTLPAFASEYANQGIPVLMVNVAISASKISFWIDGAPENYWQYLVDAYNDLGGFSYTIAVLGESDAQLNTSQAQFASELTTVTDQILSQFGCNHFHAKFPKGDAITQPQADTIYAAINQVIAAEPNVFDGGDLSNIDISQGQPGRPDQDLFHLQYTADIQEAAEEMITKVIAIVPEITISGPNTATDGDVLNYFAIATSPTGVVTSVDFFANAISIGPGVPTGQPNEYSIVYNASEGVYNINATATNDIGQVGVSNIIALSVTSVSAESGYYEGIGYSVQLNGVEADKPFIVGL